MKTALITGASTGLGKDFAFIFSKEGYDLVLVARSADKLETIAKEIREKTNRSVLVISKDLSQPEAAKDLHKEIESKGIKIDTLVNNAGFGNSGEFLDTPWEKEQEMIQLNVNFLVEATHRFAQGMKQRKSGEILNVASTAAFQPGPYMTNYYASKAFVLFFSEGIAEELAPFGVQVSVLCPGPTKTEFFERADLKGSNLLKGDFRIMDSYDVAFSGYKALKNRQVVKISGWLNFFMAQSIRFSPRFAVRKITKFLNKKPQ